MAEMGTVPASVPKTGKEILKYATDEIEREVKHDVIVF